MAISLAQSFDADCFYEKAGNQSQACFTNCSPVYLFTNDNQKAILENMDLSGIVICTTASFDHQLNSILMGAKDFLSFDLNTNAKYFGELKKQASMHLSYEEFLTLYKLERRIGGKFKCHAINHNLDKNIVSKLCCYMEEEYAYFFDKLLTLGFFDKKNIKGHYCFISKPERNMYLDKDRYYELQEKIQDVKFRGYIDTHIFNLKQYLGNEKCSAMIFSNISSYFQGEKLEYFARLLNGLEENLEEKGSIQIGYGAAKENFFTRGSNPIDVGFVLKYKDNIEEIKTGKQIITYYHK